MVSRPRVLIGGVLAAFLTVVAPAPAPPPSSTPFQSEDGRVRCSFTSGGGGPPSVRCVVPSLGRFGGIDGQGFPRRGRSDERAEAKGPRIEPGHRVFSSQCFGIEDGIVCRGLQRQEIRVTSRSVRIRRPGSFARCGTVRTGAGRFRLTRRYGGVSCRSARRIARRVAERGINGGDTFAGGWRATGSPEAGGFELVRANSRFRAGR